jgi:hypothetical protein
MKQLLFFVIFSIIDISAQAPDTLWTKTFNATGQDAGLSINKTEDGGYIMVGYDVQTNGEDVYLIKTDSYGNLDWSKSIDRSGNGTSREGGICVQQTKDNGYIILGWAMINYPDQDIWLVKTDWGGNIVWDKLFGGDSIDYANYIIETPDSGYIFIGTTFSYGAGGSDAWLIKTDKNGNTMWTKTYGESNQYETGKSIQLTDDGGYIIAGNKSSIRYEGTGDKVILIKIDSNGDPEWPDTKTFGTPDSSYVAKSCRQTFDGGYVIGGTADISGSNTYDHESVLVLKTNQAGNLEWINKYFFDGGYRANDLELAQDGGFVLVGEGSTIPPITGGINLLIFKLYLSGVMKWSIIMSYEVSSWWEGHLRSIKEVQDGSYISVGSFRSAPSYDQDVWLVKISNDPFVNTTLTANASAGSQILEVANTNGFSINDNIVINPGGATEETNRIIGFGSLQLETPLIFDHQSGEVILNLTPSSVDENQENALDDYILYNNYPNPFNPSTKIKYSVPQTSQVQIKVFDILGKEIETLVNEEKPSGTYELTWNTVNLPSGIYFYQIRAGNFIATKKMVLMK